MDQKSEIMVALGTAIGTNCIPCLDHLYSKAREFEIDDAVIKEVAEIAYKVKNGASVFMKNAIHETVGEISDTQQTCCSSGNDSC